MIIGKYRGFHKHMQDDKFVGQKLEISFITTEDQVLVDSLCIEHNKC